MGTKAFVMKSLQQAVASAGTANTKFAATGELVTRNYDF